MAKLNCVTVLAPAKLNLALDVVGLLPNGYHNLDMTMQAITLYERVVLRLGQGLGHGIGGIAFAGRGLECREHLDHLLRRALGQRLLDGGASKTRLAAHPRLELGRLVHLVGVGVGRVNGVLVGLGRALGFALLERREGRGQLRVHQGGGALVHQLGDTVGLCFLGEIPEQGCVHALRYGGLRCSEMGVRLGRCLPGIRAGLRLSLSCGEVLGLGSGQVRELRFQGLVLGLERVAGMACLGELFVGDRVGPGLAGNRCACGLVILSSGARCLCIGGLGGLGRLTCFAVIGGRGSSPACIRIQVELAGEGRIQQLLCFGCHLCSMCRTSIRRLVGTPFRGSGRGRSPSLHALQLWEKPALTSG